MPFLDFMLFWLLLQRSYANSVLQNSGLDSRDILDSPAYFTEASMGSNLLLDDLMEYDPNLASSVSLTGANIIQPESDVGLLTNLNVTAFKSDDLFISADFDLLVTDDYCSTQSPNGKRKRNSASCPVPKVPPKLDIQDDDSPTQPEAATISPSGDEKNPECEEKVFGLGRTFDVCCNGPYGPFAIDDRTRLVYNWIGDCRLGAKLPCVTEEIHACCRFWTPLLNSGIDCVLLNDGGTWAEDWLRRQEGF